MDDALPKLNVTLAELRTDSRLTDHEWLLIDKELQRALVSTAASLMRRMGSQANRRT